MKNNKPLAIKRIKHDIMVKDKKQDEGLANKLVSKLKRKVKMNNKSKKC